MESEVTEMTARSAPVSGEAITESKGKLKKCSRSSCMYSTCKI